MDPKVAIGIDFGTTYCRVGYYKNNNQFVTIPNEDGELRTPSYVSIKPYQRLVGDDAKDRAGTHATNTFYNIKRLLTHNYGLDNEEDEHIGRLPFKVKNKSNKVIFETDAVEGVPVQEILPKDLITSIFLKLKKNAENCLRKQVTHAVISIATSFKVADRQVIREAASEAGLCVARLTNEATLAAIPCYMQIPWRDDERVALICDIGGGTVSVSLVTVYREMFETKATCGNDSFAGDDIDISLVSYCVERFGRIHNIDLIHQKRALYRLRTACERAKRTLSAEDEALLEVEHLSNGKALRTIINRIHLKEHIQPLISNITDLVEKVLREAECTKESVHDVLLVGGTSKIPAIRNHISSLFQGRNNVTVSIPGFDMEFATAYGAAVQAAVLTGTADQETSEILVRDCIPRTISVEVSGGVSHTLVPRHTTLPTKRYHNFTTANNNQSGIAIRIFEGERARSKDNVEFGNYHITSGFESAPAGVPPIEIVIDLDVHDAIGVTAWNKSNGRRLVMEQVAPNSSVPPGWQIRPLPTNGIQDPPTVQREDNSRRPETSNSRVNPQQQQSGPTVKEEDTPPSYDAEVVRSLKTYRARMADIAKMTSDHNLAHLLTVRDKNKFDQSIAEMQEWLRNCCYTYQLDVDGST
ncbi:70-kilodalton heat shock protein [Tulasnella sp. 418]|nr:70-kilodalton heat shock protein [Tulasnella sp. 418]